MSQEQPANAYPGNVQPGNAEPETPRRGTAALRQLAQVPEIRQALIEHARRSIWVQFALRAVVFVFAALTVVLEPPAADRVACYAIVVAYGIFSLVTLILARRGDEATLRLIWVSLFVDLVALAALASVASASDRQSWTADILLNGFFVIPVMAATQLRIWVCFSVMIPTVAVYFACSVVARPSNDEPWSSVVLRTAIIAGLCLGCILMALGQRIRVIRIGQLLATRTRLLDELLTAEARERQDLSETLHDGALQYVLAARQDLDDLAGDADQETYRRIDHALREASGLLRSTVTQLHPAVLEQSGLLAALQRLSDDTATRGHLALSLDASGWKETGRTSADRLLFDTARELETNVVKHAGASKLHVSLAKEDGVARLVVEDDGRGLDLEELSTRLAEGHIGISSRRIRIEAAGGRIAFEPVAPHGTKVVVELPIDS